MLKFFVFAVLVVAAFTLTPFVLFGVLESASIKGIIFVAAGYVGPAIAALAFGCLGLLYRPNRFAGFVAGTFIATALMAVGTHAQTNCQQIGQAVRLCDIPLGWEKLPPHAHAEAEFRRAGGFYSQVILDPAGSNDGLNLRTATNVAIQNAQNTAGANNFELLVRGKNEGIRDSEILVYKARIEGIPFIFADTIYVGRGESIQLVTWRIAMELSKDDRAAHLDFGRGLVLMPSF